MKLFKSKFDNLYAVPGPQTVIAINRQELMLVIGYLYLHIFFDIYDDENYDDIFKSIDETDLEAWLVKYDVKNQISTFLILTK